MTTTYNPTGTGTQTSTTAKIQASDIKALIQRQGKTTIGNQEFTLREPQANDPKLQAIANDPSFAIQSVKSANGQTEIEVRAKDKTVKIKVDVKTVQ